MTILFICSGNIHRSALAEAILREEARRDGRIDVQAFSAGVVAVAGMTAVHEAAALAKEAGLDLSAHRSRPVTGEAVSCADIIVVMERFHREWLGESHPAAAARCRLLSEYGGAVTRAAGLSVDDDVPDAAAGDIESFRRSFTIIEECVKRLFRELPPAPQEVYARAIEERFRAQRHTPLTLSLADFGLVERWWNRGIPLWIVLDSIDDLFRKKRAAGEPARVRRLSYIEQEVAERLESYERSRAGTAAVTQQAAAAGGDLLKEAAARLRDAARSARLRGLPDAADIYERVAMDVTAGAEEGSAEAAAARLRLHEIEATLLSLLRALAGSDELRALHDQAESLLAGYRERMTTTAFEATVARLVAERIKDLYGAPDLAQI